MTQPFEQYNFAHFKLKDIIQQKIQDRTFYNALNFHFVEKKPPTELFHLARWRDFEQLVPKQSFFFPIITHSDSALVHQFAGRSVHPIIISFGCLDCENRLLERNRVVYGYIPILSAKDVKSSDDSLLLQCFKILGNVTTMIPNSQHFPNKIS